MSRPRLIATDLDGTFLSSDGTVSALNARAVVRAADLGIPFVAVTGRPSRWLGPVATLPGLHPTVIVSNGAAWFDLRSGAQRAVVGLDVTVGRALAEDLRAAVPGTRFGIERGAAFGCEPDCPSAELDEPRTTRAALPDLLADPAPVLKLLAYHAELGSDELLALAAPLVGDRLTLTHSTWGGRPGLIEFSAPGVDKGVALGALCADLGIGADEVAAFGDMPNDATMLARAGRPYVVANAHPSLLVGTYQVVEDNDLDGVGRTVLDLLG